MSEIKVRIHEENDLYNPLDPDKETLSDDVIDYLIRKYQEREKNDALRIHVISDEPVDEERVRHSFMSYLQHEQDIESKEYKRNTFRQIIMLIIGLAFVVLRLWVQGKTDMLLIEILSAVGSFALWEAANISISEKPLINIRKLRLKILSGTEIIFSVEDQAH